MKRVLRAVGGSFRRFVDPLLRSVIERQERMARRLDGVEGRLEAIEGRLDGLETRLERFEDLLLEVSARSSARTEAVNATAENSARVARRVEKIEKILGAP
jgi:hypothetical protein